MCTGYTQEQIRDCYDWFEEELRPLLETGGAASEEVWNEAMDDDDVIQKVNPMNMHVVVGLGCFTRWRCFSNLQTVPSTRI
jgi:hypothetical protein